jgi:hypothetical protein
MMRWLFQIIPGDALPEVFPCAECISVKTDTATSYPLIDVAKNSFKPDEDGTQKHPNSVEWGGKTYYQICLETW